MPAVRRPAPACPARRPLQKSLFTPYKGSFDAKSIKRWVDGLTAHNDGATPFAEGSVGAGKVQVVTPWDGKDGVAPSATEEFSLDDLDL